MDDVGGEGRGDRPGRVTEIAGPVLVAALVHRAGEQARVDLHHRPGRGGWKGQMLNPAWRSRRRWGMPRREPVPTEPAPPISKRALGPDAGHRGRAVRTAQSARADRAAGARDGPRTEACSPPTTARLHGARSQTSSTARQACGRTNHSGTRTRSRARRRGRRGKRRRAMRSSTTADRSRPPRRSTSPPRRGRGPTICGRRHRGRLRTSRRR